MGEEKSQAILQDLPRLKLREKNERFYFECLRGIFLKNKMTGKSQICLKSLKLTFNPANNHLKKYTTVIVIHMT
jgi:hypothetical protein